MSLEIQLEKTLFIAQEMDLALVMAEHAATDFDARSLARHVLIRAKDLIEHTGRLIKPLRDAGLDIEGLRSRRAAYMAAFDEYFATSRTKLSAHVQDVEYLERLELWTDIEVAKVSYFVEGAAEIFTTALVPLGLPSCPSWSRFGEASDSAFISSLDELRAAANRTPAVVRAGTDMLSGARPDTLSSRSFHPLHERAAQLTGIDVWVMAEVALLRRCARYPNAERILKARLVTDVVSFADCLTTRTSGGPEHRLVGFDDLLRGQPGADPSAIDTLRQVTRFDDRLEELRRVRNHIGAHYHTDLSARASDLIQELDGLELNPLLLFYGGLRHVFHLTCEKSIFLRMYLINGAVMHGALGTSGGGHHVKPFDREQHTPGTRPEPLVSNAYDQATMEEALRLWLSGGDPASLGKTYFFNTFLCAPILERVSPPVPPGRQGVSRTFEFRESHAYLQARLVGAANETEARRLLSLIAECSRGDPAPLTLILHRILDIADRKLTDGEIFEVLGGIPVHEDWAYAPLEQGLEAKDPPTVAAAAGALYRLRFEKRCLDHANNKSAAGTTFAGDVFSTYIAPLMQDAELISRLLAALVVGSMFTRPTFAASGPALERESQSIHLTILALTQEILGIVDADLTLDALMRSLDWVGLCVYLGEGLKNGGRADAAQLFFRAAAGGAVRASTIPEVRLQARLNLSVALFHVGHPQQAAAAAASVFDEGVLEPATKLRALALLIACGHPLGSVRHLLDDLERTYKLGWQENTLAAEVRRAMTAASDC